MPTLLIEVQGKYKERSKKKKISQKNKREKSRRVEGGTSSRGERR